MGKGLPRTLARRAARLALGTPSGSGNIASAEADLRVQRSKFTLVNQAIALVDEAGVVAYGSQQLLEFPEGRILFLGATANLTVEKSSAGVNDDFDGDFGLGTTAAGNNATLATTEQNLIPTTATPQASSGATTAKGGSTSTEGAKILQGESTPAEVHLNFLVDDADHDVTGTPANLVVNGTVEVLWAFLGDF